MSARNCHINRRIGGLEIFDAANAGDPTINRRIGGLETLQE